MKQKERIGEDSADGLGFKSPDLTKAQQRMPGPKIAKLLGAVIGITVGCLIGMFPLLFFDHDHDHNHDHDHDHDDGKKKKKDGEEVAGAGAAAAAGAAK